MRPPEVYRAINAVTLALSADGIAKVHTNPIELYQYRSIDDVLNRLAPLIAEHRLCILPRVLERTITERPSPATPMRVNILVRVAFDMVSVEDGSVNTVESFGEALDEGDKAPPRRCAIEQDLQILRRDTRPVCFAWNRLVDQTWRIVTIGLRRWSHGWWSVRLGVRFDRGTTGLAEKGRRCSRMPSTSTIRSIERNR